jgi:hypothetical protein
MFVVNGISLTCILLFLNLLLVLPADAQQSSSRLETPDAIGMWSKQCSGTQKLGVTIRMKSKMLYQGVLPICRGSRSGEDGRVMIHFSGGHLFQGEYPTRSLDVIEGDVWQAGGESDALILGVSFSTQKQVLLNTVHIAKPNKQTSSELDKGLFITTYPVTAR